MATESTGPEDLLDEIDAYGHRQFIKRVAKEREQADKAGNAKLEKELRALLQNLSTPEGKDLYSNPGAAQQFKTALKQMIKTGTVSPETGTTSATTEPVEAPKTEPPKTGGPRKKSKAREDHEQKMREIREAQEAARAGRGAQIPNERPPTERMPPAAETPTPAAAPAAAEAAVAPAAAARGGLRSKLGMLKSKPVMAGVGALAALGLIRTLNKKPEDNASVVNQFEKQALGERSREVARLLEKARLERTIRENQMRLARGNPDLYTSIMAGRRLPKGSVVLGGVPRQDLMRELAASMDSGRYAQPDPLSDLMG
jgi:hypothetical protein